MLSEEKIKQMASNSGIKEIIEENFKSIEEEKLNKIKGITATLERMNNEDTERKRQKRH